MTRQLSCKHKQQRAESGEDERIARTVCRSSSDECHEMHRKKMNVMMMPKLHGSFGGLGGGLTKIRASLDSTRQRGALASTDRTALRYTYSISLVRSGSGSLSAGRVSSDSRQPSARLRARSRVGMTGSHGRSAWRIGQRCGGETRRTAARPPRRAPHPSRTSAPRAARHRPRRLRC